MGLLGSLFGSSGGNSTTSSSVSNTSIDRRVVADGGAVGFSGDVSTVNITDDQATARALDANVRGLEVNSKTLLELTGLARSIVSTNAESNRQLLTISEGVGRTLATAYDKATGSDQVRYALLAMVAIVAGVALMRRARAAS